MPRFPSASTDSPTNLPSTTKAFPSKDAIITHATPSHPLPSSHPMPPLLLCSLGNPGAAYATTLHSAGHVLLSALRSHLGAPQFSKSKTFANGATSSAGDITLWQSPSYMNDSGKGVRKTYEAFQRDAPDGRLVILHDDLERPLGSVSVRTGGGALSAKGHNGIKSCLAHLRGVQDDWVRVGVGIGRPVSREKDDVAGYVLRKMSGVEKERVEGLAAEVLERLRALG